MPLNLVPLGNRIVCKPFPPEENYPTFHLQAAAQIVVAIRVPQSANRYIFEAEIVAVGPGSFDHKKKKYIPIQLKPGDVVQYPNDKGVTLVMNEEEYLILEDVDVLVKVEQLPPAPAPAE